MSMPFHLLKKSDALCLWSGRLSKLSVDTKPAGLEPFLSFGSLPENWQSFPGVDSRGVLGVRTPIDGVRDLEVLLGVGVPRSLSFWVANLRAAGDIVLRRSIVDFGEGLHKYKEYFVIKRLIEAARHTGNSPLKSRFREKLRK